VTRVSTDLIHHTRICPGGRDGVTQPKEERLPSPSGFFVADRQLNTRYNGHGRADRPAAATGPRQRNKRRRPIKLGPTCQIGTVHTPQAVVAAIRDGLNRGGSRSKRRRLRSSPNNKKVEAAALSADPAEGGTGLAAVGHFTLLSFPTVARFPLLLLPLVLFPAGWSSSRRCCSCPWTTVKEATVACCNTQRCIAYSRSQAVFVGSDTVQPARQIFERLVALGLH